MPTMIIDELKPVNCKIKGYVSSLVACVYDRNYVTCTEDYIPYQEESDRFVSPWFTGITSLSETPPTPPE